MTKNTHSNQIISNKIKNSIGKNEKLLLFTLAAINFTHIVDFMIMMPLGPRLMDLFKIGPKEHAALVSAYTFAAGATSFMAAFIIDRFDRKISLFIAYFLFSIGTLGCAFAPNYELLLFARIITGAFGGFLSGQVLSIVGDIFPLERRGSAMGIVMTSFSIASVAGVPFSLFLANKFEWHAPFIFVGFSGFLILFLILRFLPSMRSHILDSSIKRPGPAKILQRIVADANQVRALLFTVVILLGHFSVVPFLSPYMVSNVGFKNQDLPWIYLIGGGLTIFTAPLVGKMSDKHGKFFIFTIFSALVTIPVLWITHMGVTPLWLALVATTIFFAFANGRMVPSMTMTTAVVPQSERGSFMSINSSLQQISMGAAAYLGGQLLSTNAQGEIINYSRVGYLAVVMSAIGWWVGKKIQLRN